MTRILLGDCIEQMKLLGENSVDCIVTDPPYGWRFMGKAWDDADILIKSRQAKRPGETYVGSDGIRRKTRSDASMAAGKYDQTLKGNLAFMEWTRLWAEEAMRILKPGAHVLVFCGPRTYHAMAMGVEMAGFEIRDQLQWVFGSGFPKSHNIGNGIGTALKPANEPIVLARKPLEKGLTVAENVLKWGCGGLNIDDCRIGPPQNTKVKFASNADAKNTQGRWPSNLLLDEQAAEMLDAQSGQLSQCGGPKKTTHDEGMFGIGTPGRIYKEENRGASRFFYVAKASKSERNAGLEVTTEKMSEVEGAILNHDASDNPNTKGRKANPIDCITQNKSKALGGNNHPTVKPVKLMEYLITLVCPPSGIVLDPFCGSGSTGVAAKKLGVGFIGIEMNDEYAEIATKRIANA